MAKNPRPRARGEYHSIDENGNPQDAHLWDQMLAEDTRPTFNIDDPRQVAAAKAAWKGSPSNEELRRRNLARMARERKGQK